MTPPPPRNGWKRDFLKDTNVTLLPSKYGPEVADGVGPFSVSVINLIPNHDSPLGSYMGELHLGTAIKDENNCLSYIAIGI